MIFYSNQIIRQTHFNREIIERSIHKLRNKAKIVDKLYIYHNEKNKEDIYFRYFF
jgi:hypothetical protein